MAEPEIKKLTQAASSAYSAASSQTASQQSSSVSGSSSMTPTGSTTITGAVSPSITSSPVPAINKIKQIISRIKTQINIIQQRFFGNELSVNDAKDKVSELAKLTKWEVSLDTEKEEEVVDFALEVESEINDDSNKIQAQLRRKANGIRGAEGDEVQKSLIFAQLKEAFLSGELTLAELEEGAKEMGNLERLEVRANREITEVNLVIDGETYTLSCSSDIYTKKNKIPDYSRMLKIGNVSRAYDAYDRELYVRTDNADGSYTILKGGITTHYDKDGKVVSKDVNNADKSNTVEQNGVKTTTYPDGRKIVEENGVKTTTYPDGRKIVEENGVKTTYYSNGQKLVVKGNVETLFDENDKEIKVTTRNSDKSYLVKEGNVETLFDKDDKVVSVTTYNEDGSKTVEKSDSKTIYYKDGSKLVIEGNKETLYDKNDNVISITIHNADKSTTVIKDGVTTITFANGQRKVISGNVETLFNSDGEVVSIKTMSTDGSYTVQVGNETMFYNKDGQFLYKRIDNEDGGYIIVKDGKETAYDKDGKPASDKIKNEDGTYTVVEGNKEMTFDAEGKLLRTVEYVYDKNGKLSETLIYDSDGKLIQRNGSNNRLGDYTFTYQYDKSGKLVKIIRKSMTADGRVRIARWNANDNGYEIMGIEELNLNANMKYSALVQAALYGYWEGMVIEDYGQLTWDFLSYASVINDGCPENATEIEYNGETYQKYANYLNGKIASEITEPYGYEADEVKGYYFNSSSRVAQTIAGNKDFLNFVKNNLTALKNGLKTTKALEFKKSNSKELYYSLHWVNVIDSWTDDDGKLHVVLADTYDFKGNTSGFGGYGNALMIDGNLVPYYSVIEVVVDI